MGTYLDHAATKNRAIRLGGVVPGASWLDLVAETTPGMGTVACYRAQVRCSDLVEGHAYRLIVQVYARSEMASDLVPRPGARPLGSCQRAVDAEQLRRGVEVNLVDLTSERDVVVVAWTERGFPDLEFDALRARPESTGRIGSAVSRGGARVAVVIPSGSARTAQAA